MPRNDRRTPSGRRLPALRLERLEERQLLSALSHRPDSPGAGHDPHRLGFLLAARARHIEARATERAALVGVLSRERGAAGFSTPDARPQDIVSSADPSAVGTPPANAYYPAQIRKAYGFDQIPEQGQGLTIAIVDAFDDPNIASDLSVFSATFGLPQMDGLNGDPTFAKAFPQETPEPNTSWGGEISLDVEWVHALAPMANILLVETVDAMNVNLYASPNSGVNYAKAQQGVVVVSNSYGGDEFPGELADDANFLPLAGQPVAITYGAGDAGSASRYPAASPNVIAVGGTFLATLSASGRYGIESAWSNGGGGPSLYEPRPSYQAGLPFGNTRTIPDVAFDAAPNTGVAVYNTFSETGWVRVGGNSFASPAWASLIALADQARLADGLPALTSDEVHAALYADYNSPNYLNDFHDITTGSNTNGYQAGPGYDLATGIGTPKVPGVVQTLANAP
jgi:subtilase family serine protease